MHFTGNHLWTGNCSSNCKKCQYIESKAVQGSVECTSGCRMLESGSGESLEFSWDEEEVENNRD